MSEERTVAPVSSDDRIRRASSPSTSAATPANGHSVAQNWLHAATWKERYLMEPIKRKSPISMANEPGPQDAVTGESIADRPEEAPLDFSMKKRKLSSGVETRISRSPLRDDDILSAADATSPTYGLMKAFLEGRASSPSRRPDSDAETVPTESSPFCLSNRRGPSNLLLGPTGAFPLSLAAAAAVVNANFNSQQQNLGASANGNRRHYLTQQLLQRQERQNQGHDGFGRNSTSVNSDNGDDREQSQSSNDNPAAIGDPEPHVQASTRATPPAFFGGVTHSPHNGARSSQQQQKVQRPFKAYNPMDPMSALQVGAALAPSTLPFLNAALAPSTAGISTSSPHLLPNPLTSPTTTTSPNALPPLLNAQLLSQYRQYLINAQAAAAVAALRAKSSQHLQRQLNQPLQRHVQRQQTQLPHDAMATSLGSQFISNASSQSPPQVTSTSHPHTAESSSSASSTASPPSPAAAKQNQNGTTIAGVIAAANGDRFRNANLQQTKPANGDRRISSGSGSGGSSFNGGDEDDEELLHEDDDDGVSTNRTSPTPSCASSTAVRRSSILSTGDGAGMFVGNGSGNGSNGASSKAENGSNGSSGRRKGRSLPDSLKDEAYWERRRKNNEAAKRSRDARRAKEDEIAIRAALLEQENMRLRIEVAATKAEVDELRQRFLNA